LLKTFMRDNTEQMLGKMIGLVQKGFGYCPIITLVAISRSGVIEVASGALHKGVLKADEIAPEIARQIASLKKKARLLNLSLDTGWEMTVEEAAKVASVLVSAHSQKQPQRQEVPPSSKESPLPVGTQAGTAPRVGAPCPKCGTRKLVRKSVQRSDGTETDFLACSGHPQDCTQIFALMTKLISAPETEDVPRLGSTATITDKQPRRKSGKKYCYKCKADIEQKVADYCFDRSDQFGGRAYCRRCQVEFRRVQ
jgi:ssDNA-binding Zn-finger/Zn-ribbon topoisomerase 1